MGEVGDDIVEAIHLGTRVVGKDVLGFKIRHLRPHGVVVCVAAASIFLLVETLKKGPKNQGAAQH